MTIRMLWGDEEGTFDRRDQDQDENMDQDK